MLIAGLCLFLLGVSWGRLYSLKRSPLLITLQVVSLSPGPRPVFSVYSSVEASSYSFCSLSGVSPFASNQDRMKLINAEIFSGMPNPLVPMHFFKDLRGFVCLIVIASVSGTIYVAMSIIWPSQVVAIYGAQATSWQSDAWLSTTIAFGIYGGIVLLGPFVAIIKHVRIQLIVLMSTSVAFLGAMASVNSSNFGRSAAFSFIAIFPGDILELIPALMVQMDSNDADLGTVFSIIFCFRTAVGAIMAAISVAILEAKIPIGIAKYVPQAATAAGLPQSSQPSPRARRLHLKQYQA